MSNAARPAPTCASPTTPAATGTVRSARPLLPRRGSPTARANCCPCPIITWCHIAGADRRHCLPEHDRDLRHPVQSRGRDADHVAADPKHLGARIGLTAALYSWGSALTHHPHVHVIVPGGGLSLNGQRWISCRPGFFLPVRVLSRLFRRLFLAQLVAAHDTGRVQFFGGHALLAGRRAFTAYLAPLRRAEWGRLQQAPS